MIKCTNPACGAENSDGSKFCELCGTPLPQEIKCSSCGNALLPNQRFCPMCGTPASGKAGSRVAGSSGIAVGDKNVIAGDVTGSKDSYNISGSATIIRNEDETKKLVVCSVCGKRILIAQSIICRVCGQTVCEDHFDSARNCCSSCVDNLKNSAVEQYKDALKHIYADGRKDAQESRELLELQKKLGLSDQVAMELELPFRPKVLDSFALTEFEKTTLATVEKRFMEMEESDEDLERVKKILDSHPNNEKALSVYLQMTLVHESENAKALCDEYSDKVLSGGADLLPVHLCTFELAMKDENFVAAEKEITAVERLWPDFKTIQCYKADYFYTVGNKLGDQSFIAKAFEIASAIDPESFSSLTEKSRAIVTKKRYELLQSKAFAKADSVMSLIKEQGVLDRFAFSLISVRVVTVSKNEGLGEYKSINKALLSQQKGELLYIKLISPQDVCFTENISLNSVILEGVSDLPSGDKTKAEYVINSPSTSPAISISGSAGLRNIIVTSTNGGEGVVIENGNHVEISDCTISTTGRTAVVVKNSKNVELNDSLVMDSKANDLAISNSQVEIKNSTFDASDGPQVVLNRESSATFTNCKIVNGKHKGVIVDSESKAVFENCSFKNIEGFDVEARNSGVCNLKKCKKDGGQLNQSAHDDGVIEIED